MTAELQELTPCMCRASVLTVLVAQIQVCSCLDEQLDAWQISHGTDKVKSAAHHRRCQYCEDIPARQSVSDRGRRAWYVVIKKSN